MKILAIICCCLLLSACTLPTIGNQKSTPDQPEQIVPYDQQLFTAGVNQLLNQQRPESLFELKENFPGSAWSRQAEGILEMHNRLERQQQRLNKLEKQLKESASDQTRKQAETELAKCATEKAHLQQELDTLNQRLEALRELTIEMELK